MIKNTIIAQLLFSSDILINSGVDRIFFKHGSYNLDKVSNFVSRLGKSFNFVKVLENYLISLLGLEKSLKFSNLSMLITFGIN